MSKKIDVSIIIPMYNVEDYVERCVESIKSQKFTNYEAIFIDDGSTDLTNKTFSELLLDTRFKLYTKKNEGSGPARNYGLNISQGEYVYFMDPDDQINENLLSENIPLIKNKNADILIFGYQQFDLNNNKITNFIPTEFKYAINSADFQKSLNDIYLETSIHAVWNKIYKKEFLQKNDFLFSNLSTAQDAKFNWEIFRKVKRAIINNNSYYMYYLNREGSARTKYSSNTFFNEIEVLKTMEDTVNNWRCEEKFNFIVNSYKINIIRNEFKSIKRSDIVGYSHILKNGVYKDVLNIKYRELSALKDKIKLFLIKSNLISYV